MKPSSLERIALAWLADDHKARMIVTVDGSALWLNAGARSLLERSCSLVLVDQNIKLPSKEDDERLHVFLRSLHSRPGTAAFKFKGEDSFCVFRGWQVADAGHCCLDIHFSTVRHGPTLVDFQHVFGLTNSEARTASALYSGQTAQDVAEAQAISIQTVRTHIRQVYSKIGVTGREQLFRQLDPFRLD